jgi:Tol biopolymer transport system component
VRRIVFFVLTAATLVSACTGAEEQGDVWRLAFEDTQSDRIAVCRLDGGGLTYITPDSLIAFGPVTDSTHRTVYFVARSKAIPEGLFAIYAIEVDGTYLRKLTDLPLSPQDLQITPDGGTMIFTGKYPDQEYVRGYQMRIGESGFHAVTPPDRNTLDPSMAPGGLNFVWHDGSQDDTLLVSSLDQILTMPIYEFPYTQVSIRPDGLAFAATFGDDRRGLCHLDLQDSLGQLNRTETVLVPETDGIAIGQPIFHPDGVRIAYVRSTQDPPFSSTIHLIDRNSLEITKIPVDLKAPTHPTWVR